MNKKCVTVLAIIITVIAIAIVYVCAILLVNKLAMSAIKDREYDRLKKIVSFPLIKPNGLMIEDLIDSIFERPQNSYPLEYACTVGDSQAVEILLNGGVDPNRKHKFGIQSNYLCLDVAISRCDVQLTELLIQHGAHSGDIYRALSNALNFCKSNDLRSEMVFPSIYELLVRNELIKESDAECKLLVTAVQLCDQESAEYLVSNCGYEWTWVNGDGQTLLHICCISGFTSENDKLIFSSALILHGVDKTVCDSKDKTAYDYAVENGYVNLANLLKP